ncbi:MAG: histone deacetylase [Chloroflexi bacterium]|nr:MAG: histone deacetylase [Chloroflexota bacterium]
MKIFYTDQFQFPLPDKHYFPLHKYSMLREAIEAAGLVSPDDMIVPDPVTDEQILRAHSSDYLQRVKSGQLTGQEIRRLGLPWSLELVTRARHTAGGTIAACRAALRDGVAVNLAGGTHHASRDRAQGFCLFNDVIIAARAMQAEGRARRVVILDCDVHQGNGSAALAAGDPTIFTFSIHNEQNFPLHKEPGDLDIGLNDGTGDTEYLAALEPGVRRALELAEADLAIYLAGADPYAGDLLGRFELSKEGLVKRDRMVLAFCREAGLPAAVTLAGGYGRRIEETVEIHLQTVRIAAEMDGTRAS